MRAAVSRRHAGELLYRLLDRGAAGVGYLLPLLDRRDERAQRVGELGGPLPGHGEALKREVLSRALVQVGQFLQAVLFVASLANGSGTGGVQGAGQPGAAVLHAHQDGGGEVGVVASGTDSKGGMDRIESARGAQKATAARPVGIVGGGIVGLAVARRLTGAGVPVVVFEKEPAVATHQTGHNSGVVHAGIYYAPGSAKAKMCRRGVGLLREYCADRGLTWDERGKLVIARDAAETLKLRELERRSQANGVPGIQWLEAPEMRALEPDVAGVAALLSPTTAIVDYPAIARSFAADVARDGGQVLTGTPVTALRAGGDDRVEVDTPGRAHQLSRLVICAGLQADLVAAAAGDEA